MKIDLNTKYNFGEEIYAIAYEIIEVKEKCGICGGKGRIKGLDHSTISCPPCEGTGSIVNDIKFEWQIFRLFVISEIIVRLTSNNTSIFYKYEDKSFPEENCFKTATEAEKVCSERNLLFIS